MERLTLKEFESLECEPYVLGGVEYYGYSYGGEVINKLAKYEDLEEQGLFLKLPCKVGDTVWYIDDDDDDYPLELLVTKIEVEENGYLRYHAREKDNCGKIGFIKDDIGKTVFLTKEEAEQALAEMKEV